MKLKKATVLSIIAMSLYAVTEFFYLLFDLEIIDYGRVPRFFLKLLSVFPLAGSAALLFFFITLYSKFSKGDRS